MAAAFSAAGGLFATLGGDGHLRVYDTASAALRFDVVADLTDPACCMAWQSLSSPAPRPTKASKRKRRSAAPRIEEVQESAHLVLGSSQGKVVLVHAANAEQTVLGQEHSGRVNGAAWAGANGCLYTCSSDGTIVEWADHDGRTAKQTSWLADKRSVTAVARGATDETLLSAGSHIKLWDLESKTELHKFNGHEQAVSVLVAAPHGVAFSGVYGDPTDTFVGVWSLGDDRSKKSTAMLRASGAVSHVCVDTTVEEGTLRALSVTDGCIEVFSAVLPAKRLKQPIEPAGSISLTTGDVPSAPVPVLATMFDHHDPAHRLILARGSALAPVFETVDYAADKGDVHTLKLTREAPATGLLAPAQTLRKRGSKGAERMVGIVDGAAAAGKAGKRARVVPEEKTLAEQIKALELGESGDTSAPTAKAAKPGAQPMAGSLAQMLVQALHSNDNALLEECLSNSNVTTVQSTVARLPKEYVVRFLSGMVSKVQAKPARGLTLLVWIRAVLVVHTSYLMTVPDLASVLASLYSLIDARLNVFPKLLRLSGRLELMLSQVTIVCIFRVNSWLVWSRCRLFTPFPCDTHVKQIAAEEQQDGDEAFQVPVVRYHEEDTEDEDDDMGLLSDEDDEENWEDIDDSESDSENEDEDYDEEEEDDDDDDDEDDE
eukprot:m.95635 g.95635  ORF g.95635 m.95635 type:complete len:659 (-) comp15161_c0_seq2:224-2200(-)